MDDISLFRELAKPAAHQPAPLAVVTVLWTLFVGSTIGSFLNVVIARVPAGISVVRPRSRCPACGAQIAWFDNVPVLSWIVLRARCRACRAPISARYPLVEALVGTFAAAIALRYGLNVTGLELFAFACVLVVVAFIDLDTFYIPLVFPGLLLVLGLATGAIGELASAPFAVPAWLRGAYLDEGSPFLERALGAVVGLVALSLINVVATYWARRRGTISGDEFAMGWGDPLLVGGIGAVLGWHALPWIVFLASLQGAVVGLALRRFGAMPAEHRSTAFDDEEWVPPPSAMPFGPFLALAGLEVAFFGDRLAQVMPSLTQLL